MYEIISALLAAVPGIAIIVIISICLDKYILKRFEKDMIRIANEHTEEMRAEAISDFRSDVISHLSDWALAEAPSDITPEEEYDYIQYTYGMINDFIALIEEHETKEIKKLIGKEVKGKGNVNHY